jgi:hypothetical protein
MDMDGFGSKVLKRLTLRVIFLGEPVQFYSLQIVL